MDWYHKFLNEVFSLLLNSNSYVTYWYQLKLLIFRPFFRRTEKFYSFNSAIRCQSLFSFLSYHQKFMKLETFLWVFVSWKFRSSFRYCVVKSKKISNFKLCFYVTKRAYTFSRFVGTRINSTPTQIVTSIW